jgi:hypothetical protein
MKRIKDYAPPILAGLAVLAIIGTALTAALTGPTPTIHAVSSDWTNGYDAGHVQGACVALTGSVECDWTHVTVCPDGQITPPCVIWQGDQVVLYLDHVCPWLPDDEAMCVDRNH